MRGVVTIPSDAIKYTFQRIVSTLEVNYRPEAWPYIRDKDRQAHVEMAFAAFLYFDLTRSSPLLLDVDWRTDQVNAILMEYLDAACLTHENYGVVLAYVRDQFVALAHQLRAHLKTAIDQLCPTGETLQEIYFQQTFDPRVMALVIETYHDEVVHDSYEPQPIL